MQIPPPQICSKCFVCICRSTTNLQWSNINIGSIGWCKQILTQSEKHNNNTDVFQVCLLVMFSSDISFYKTLLSCWFAKAQLTEDIHHYCKRNYKLHKRMDSSQLVTYFYTGAWRMYYFSKQFARVFLQVILTLWREGAQFYMIF